MAKFYVQGSASVLSHTGTLTADQEISGSLLCLGYAKLCGLAWASCPSETGSGLRIYESANAGDSFECLSASDQLAASGSATYSLDVHGDAVKVFYKNGGTAAGSSQILFYLRPV